MSQFSQVRIRPLTPEDIKPLRSYWHEGYDKGRLHGLVGGLIIGIALGAGGLLIYAGLTA